MPEVAALPRAKADLISTEDMMRAAGIRIVTSQVSIRAEAAGTTVGRLLKLPARTPVLVLRRKAIGADGSVKEVEPRLVLLRRLRARLHDGSPAAENFFDIRNVEERH